jgi:protein-disulfide isomerase
VRRHHLWAAAALVVGTALGYLLSQATAEDPQPILYGLPPGDASGEAVTPDAAPVDVKTADRPARGPADAEVTMVEFVDFECPFCGSYARETLPRIERVYGDRIRYVSRHFPLAIHDHAELAARAAECAYEEGRYWAYHRSLFVDQQSLERRALFERARALDLDMERFSPCVNSDAVRAQVEDDVADGRRYGVTGTPTFFINGVPLRGAQPFEEFAAAIDAALDGQE